MRASGLERQDHPFRHVGAGAVLLLSIVALGFIAPRPAAVSDTKRECFYCDEGWWVNCYDDEHMDAAVPNGPFKSGQMHVGYCVPGDCLQWHQTYQLDDPNLHAGADFVDDEAFREVEQAFRDADVNGLAALIRLGKARLNLERGSIQVTTLAYGRVLANYPLSNGQLEQLAEALSPEGN